MEAFVGMQVLPANHRDTDYKEKRDYQESVTTGQTDTRQSDPRVAMLCKNQKCGPYLQYNYTKSRLILTHIMHGILRLILDC